MKTIKKILKKHIGRKIEMTLLDGEKVGGMITGKHNGVYSVEFYSKKNFFAEPFNHVFEENDAQRITAIY